MFIDILSYCRHSYSKPNEYVIDFQPVKDLTLQESDSTLYLLQINIWVPRLEPDVFKVWRIGAWLICLDRANP